MDDILYFAAGFLLCLFFMHTEPTLLGELTPPSCLPVDYQQAEFQAVNRQTYHEAYWHGLQSGMIIQTSFKRLNDGDIDSLLTRDSTNFFNLLYGPTDNTGE